MVNYYSEDPEKENEEELMKYYHLKGKIGKIKLYHRLIKSWILLVIASFIPTYNLSVSLHRARGVKIGKHVYLGPNIMLDLLHPELITIEDYVSIGMNTMIFCHSNPTNSVVIKKLLYPRKIAPVTIKKGTWIAPRCTILCGVTIGENCVIGACSLVTKDVPSYSLAAGVPAKIIKNLDEIRIALEDH